MTFRSAEHALDWAYNTIGRPIVKMSAINHMRQVPSRGAVNILLVNLTLQDIHGQAAQIIGMVERLPDRAKRQYIAAKFGRKLGKDDITSVVFLGRVALGLGFDKSDAIYKLVRGYFDGKCTHREARRILGCRDNYAVMVRRCLYDTLDAIHDRAMADIGDVFRQHGLIGEASYSS